MEKPVLPTARISLAMIGETSKADIALQVVGYTRGYGEKVLLRNAEMTIACGERVALVGPNGSGKTTFLRDVVEKARWDDTTLSIGPSLRVGYCAQHQEVFDGLRTVLDEFLSLGPFTRKEVYAAVSRFLFRWGTSTSGSPELHGIVLLVSHARYLLDKVTTRIVILQNRSLAAFSGSFSEYWAQPERSPRPTARAAAAPGKRKDIGAAFAAGDRRRGRDLSTRLQRTARLLEICAASGRSGADESSGALPRGAGRAPPGAHGSLTSARPAGSRRSA